MWAEGRWCLQLECKGGDEDGAEEHVVPADKGAMATLIFRSLYQSTGAPGADVEAAHR